jgi:hypothetical protein
LEENKNNKSDLISARTYSPPNNRVRNGGRNRSSTVKNLTNFINEIKCLDNGEESTFKIKLDPNIKKSPRKRMSSM